MCLPQNLRLTSRLQNVGLWGSTGAWLIKGCAGLPSTSRWQEPLSLSSIFLLDDPTLLIFLNPKAQWLNSAVTQEPSGNDRASLLKCTNQIKNMSYKHCIYIYRKVQPVLPSKQSFAFNLCDDYTSKVSSYWSYFYPETRNGVLEKKQTLHTRL